MKMRNNRSGHGPVFGGIWVLFGLGLMILLGWPVSIPAMGFLIAVGDLIPADSLLSKTIVYGSCVIGIYVHIRLWVWFLNYVRR